VSVSRAYTYSNNVVGLGGKILALASARTRPRLFSQGHGQDLVIQGRGQDLHEVCWPRPALEDNKTDRSHHASQLISHTVLNIKLIDE